MNNVEDIPRRGCVCEVRGLRGAKSEEMARRKGISTNVKSRNALDMQMTSGRDAPPPNAESEVAPPDNEIKWADNMPPAQQKQRFDYAFTNNNDQKYLHKKFKKRASTVANQPLTENEIQSKEPDRPLCLSQPPTPYKVPATTQCSLALTNIREDEHNTQVYEAKIQNNVQTKFKDIYDVTNPPATFERSHSDWSDKKYNEEKNLMKTDTSESDVSNAKDNTVNVGYSGRYICPYCKLSCAKPSVLQKHIRAHTNERPYPCVPCGFAFKTKSNLYKHCRSRTHALRLQGGENMIPSNEDDWSMGSESDTSLPAAPLSDASISVDAVSLRMDTAMSDVSSPESMLLNERVTPPNTSAAPLSQTEVNKSKAIYKPKFHKASLYQDEEQKSKKLLSPNPDFLNQHISKIISDNEAIVETIDSPLQKKYSKITNLQKQMALNDNMNNISMCEGPKHESQPLNLTKDTTEETMHRKRCYSESFANQEHHKVLQHPLNPEGSIIKDLLLKARAQASGLMPVTQETYDPTETLYICPLCQIPYRSADNLEIHQLYYCKGNKNLNGLGTSQHTPKESLKIYRPEHIYMRSNSVNVTLPESYTPNTLAKLATSTLKSPINFSRKPDNLVIIKPENDIAAPLPSPGPLLGNTRLVDSRIRTGSANKSVENNLKTIKPLNSPKRRSEITSDRFSPLSMENKGGIQRFDMYSPKNKMRCMETNPTTLRSLEELSLAPMRQNSNSLQMFGGEVKIVDDSGEIRTFRIEADNRSPTLVPQSSPNNTQNKVEQTEKSSIVVRSGLHSGGTIVQNMPTPKETDRSPMPSTPRILMSMASNISSPSFSLSGIPVPNITHFQFPPLGSITAFNPLTLPALSPSLTPNGATTILHGGKLIPYVPGIPGPNTPSSYISAITSQSKYMQSPESRSFSPGASKEDIYPRLNILSPKAKIPKQDLNLPIRGSIKSPNTRIMSQETVEKSRVSLLNTQKPIESDIGNRTLLIPSVKIVNVDNNPQVRVTSTNGYSRRQDLLQRSSAVRDSLLIEVSEGRSKEIHNDSQVTSRFIESGTPEKEIRNFNFENFISKSEIYNNVSSVKSVSEDRLESSMQPLTVAIQTFERSETSYFKKSNDTSSKSSKDDSKTKFLRPSSLPLKPGTFIPKKHHGITPNANTMPLISPETPRPAKAYGQLYLNGHAYTYLGLKCSTKVYYCTLNRPQPTYVPNQHSLSMYSNWQICSEAAPHPLGLSAGCAMAQYDSRHRPQTYPVSNMRQELRLTHSSQWNRNSDVKQTCAIQETDKSLDGKQNSDGLSRKELAGGFESNEEYTYVRGRGRGRYVCSECGIRCKKPSMLKKHIRTHTDVRPYTCKHCVFSFKTKGNLTKHMKSKAHYKKCCELGISPSEGAEVREGVVEAQGSGDTDEETDSDADDGNEGETESSDTDSWKSRLPEHEAAQSLLSLWGAPPSSTAPGLLTSARPSTYPYTPSAHHDHHADPLQQREPMDLSKSDLQHTNITQVVTAPREPSVLASLAQNTAKLPKHQNHWGSGEPMLHAYLTEKALQDSKIKESQYTACKLRKLEEARQSHIRMNNSDVGSEHTVMLSYSESVIRIVGVEDRVSSLSSVPTSVKCIDVQSDGADIAGMETLADIATSSVRLSSSCKEMEVPNVSTVDIVTSTENAKFVASEYLKMASGKGEKLFDRNTTLDGIEENSSINVHHIDDHDNFKERKDGEVKKMHTEHTPVARNVVVGAGGVVPSSVGDYVPTSAYAPVYASGHLADDGRSVCAVCDKSFLKPSQLRLHINIHYMERPFRCSACAVSFRTRGHLQKHERSGSHHNKVSMTSTFGTATSSNPRPFKCSDCKIAFRIHGHLAKHLRSKMHVMRLECLGKLPFGTFAEIEREGVSLTDIDTTDCANSLASLQLLAQKLHEKDPTKLESWDPATMVPPLLPAGRESSDEDESSPVPITKYSATDT